MTEYLRQHQGRQLDLSGAGLAARAGGSPKAAALAYAAAGWPVMPVAGVVNGVCACRQRGACEHPAKHPLIPGGTAGASTDPRQIDQWFSYWRTAGVGVLTGHRSGLAVVDLDPRHGGDITLTRLRERGFALPATLTAETGGGGRHFVFATGGLPVGNTSGRLAGVGETPGIDLRGDGGYVVAAPSRHITGGTYRWFPGPDVPATLPSWIAAAPATKAAAPVIGAAVGAGYGEQAIEGEANRVRTALEGLRNDTLNRAAFSLGTLVGAGEIDRGAAESALTAAAATVGMPEREARRTIASGMNSGIERPRTVRPPAAQAPPAGRSPHR